MERNRTLSNIGISSDYFDNLDLSRFNSISKSNCLSSFATWRWPFEWNLSNHSNDKSKLHFNNRYFNAYDAAIILRFYCPIAIKASQKCWSTYTTTATYRNSIIFWLNYDICSTEFRSSDVFNSSFFNYQLYSYHLYID